VGLKSRLEALWSFIDEHLEVDYGYIPKSHMDDKDDSRVDEYIQEIKSDFKKMREKGWIKVEFIQVSIDVLRGLDDI